MTGYIMIEHSKANVKPDKILIPIALHVTGFLSYIK